MKPLKLEFSGLNSYRDAQTVDFEELGQSGLFGIFGPTGSGKSTILDAVTLALCGTVDRSPSTRRKRSACRQGRNCYSCGSAHSVLQGSRAPPRQIRRIPNDRANMLGHIFNLERFGDQLYKSADRRRGQHQGQINEAETAKAEIGDCSDTAIQGAQADAKKAQEGAKCSEEAHLKAKKELTNAAELKKLNDNLKATQARRVALDARKAAIDQDQTKLDAARRAAPLRTVIDAVTRLDSEQEKAADKAKQTSADRDVAQSKLSTAEAEARSARERQEKEEPSLIERKAKLETALSEKKKLDETVLKRDGLGGALREMEGKIGEAKQEVSSREIELKTLVDAIESLSQEQQSLAVDSDHREHVDKAVAFIAPLEGAELERIKSQRDLDGKRIASDTARRQVLRVFAGLSQIAASRYSLSDTGVLVEETAVIPSMNDAPEERNSWRLPTVRLILPSGSSLRLPRWRSGR